MTSPNSINSVLTGDSKSLVDTNEWLELKSAEERVSWALRCLPGKPVLISSFGIQSAVMLHLVTSVKSEIPVVLIDTGYLFKETYQFINELTDRLKLNLHVYRSKLPPATQEKLYGKLWEQGLDGLTRYNQLNKVEPMSQALKKLNAGVCFSGLRRQQSLSRKNLSVLRMQDNRLRMYPIINWSNRDVHRYLKKNNLPYHPLWEKGYVSVGDYHSSQPLIEGMRDEDTRFFGLKRECGLHD